MALGPRLDLRQSQSLVMTPQLRQAIQLLQYSNLEAAAFVADELERNPLLERDEASDDAAPPERPAPDQVASAVAPETDVAAQVRAEAVDPPFDCDHAETYDPGGASDGVRIGAARENPDAPGPETAASGPTLREHLAEQVRLTFADRTERAMATRLVDLLAPSGRLSVDPESLAVALGIDFERLEQVRQHMLHHFDPTGMFAVDLRECLAAQLAERDRLDPAMATLLDNLGLLARHDQRNLMALCGVDAEDLTDMVAEIRRLDPKPGALWDAQPPATLVPDVIMRATPDGGWRLELNPETMPRVLVNHAFTARVLPGATREARSFIIDRLATATWLVKSLHQRAETIIRVAAEIVLQQDAFFRHGISHLRPLILRDVAGAVELHESTVSRVTANKAIATPRGIFDLKYFFTTALPGSDGGEAVSAAAVRARIRSMVAGETADTILSDDAIVLALRREGVDIARRTVAKYREALRIPSSVQRRREKAMA